MARVSPRGPRLGALLAVASSLACGRSSDASDAGAHDVPADSADGSSSDGDAASADGLPADAPADEGPPADAGSPGLCVPCLAFAVGRPVVLRRQTACGTPDLQIGDGPVVLTPYGEEVLGFFATQETRVWRAPRGTPLPDLFAGPSSPALLRSGVCADGAPACPDYDGATLDACGAWVMAAHRDTIDPTRLHVFYHQETACDYARGTSYKSAAYATSTDGTGFTKPGHPDNTVLMVEEVRSCRTDPSLDCWDYGWGDFGVVVFGDFFYMYSGKGVARAARTSGGVPGSWSLMAGGAFPEPGPILQPDFEALHDTEGNWLGAVKSPSVYARRDAVMLAGVDADAGALSLAFSADGATGWVRLGEPLFFAESAPPDRDFSGYVSVYGASRTDRWSDAFDVFYAHRSAGADDCAVEHVARRVEVRDGETALASQVRVELSRYQTADGGLGPDHWVTTSPLGIDGYAYEGAWGHVLTIGGPGRVALWDCYDPSAADHYNAVGGCVGSDPGRLTGYLLESEAADTHALYRCAWETSPGRINHITGTDCAELPTEALLGYAYAARFAR